MSWFDTTGIASLAKNALKEAQKTIDKALDINDDTANRAKGPAKGGTFLMLIFTFYNTIFASAPPVVEEDSADSFFSSWSVKSPASPPSAKRGTSNNETKAIEEEPTPSNSGNTIWGSFTGSFFEADSLKPGLQGARKLSENIIQYSIHQIRLQKPADNICSIEKIEI
jgi:TATA element modulatory factor